MELTISICKQNNGNQRVSRHKNVHMEHTAHLVMYKKNYSKNINQYLKIQKVYLILNYSLLIKTGIYIYKNVNIKSIYIYKRQLLTQVCFIAVKVISMCQLYVSSSIRKKEFPVQSIMKQKKGKNLSILYEFKIIGVFWVRWTVDIGLDSSVVEHLTSEGVPGSTSDPFSFFGLCIC